MQRTVSKFVRSIGLQTRFDFRNDILLSTSVVNMTVADDYEDMTTAQMATLVAAFCVTHVVLGAIFAKFRVHTSPYYVAFEAISGTACAYLAYVGITGTIQNTPFAVPQSAGWRMEPAPAEILWLAPRTRVLSGSTSVSRPRSTALKSCFVVRGVLPGAKIAPLTVPPRPGRPGL